MLSGGHSSLFAVEGSAVATLGETRDDAIGEVFDKVGKRLGLPYPQGPRVDELAERGDAAARRMPVPLAGGETLEFDSFECAIHRLAPRCIHCGIAVVGHGVEDEGGTVYCCANCAHKSGVKGLDDRV